MLSFSAARALLFGDWQQDTALSTVCADVIALSERKVLPEGGKTGCGDAVGPLLNNTSEFMTGVQEFQISPNKWHNKLILDVKYVLL